jgi:DNA modification methylase
MSDGYIYTFQSDKGIFKMRHTMDMLRFKYIQTLIWYGKNGFAFNYHNHNWSYRHEPILFAKTGKPEDLLYGKGIEFHSVIDVPRPQSNYAEGKFHPTEKPVKLYDTLIARTPSTLILDPYLGAGASAVSATRHKRKFIGIDLNEEYCEHAAKRCECERTGLTIEEQDAGQTLLFED